MHEVIRDLGVLCLHTCSESSTLTADPKQKVKTAFRCARQGIHDAVAGGSYAAKIAKEKGLKRWMTCSPDYAYGRDNTAEFIQYAKVFEPSIEVVDQLWPKLFAPDYTESITKILQVKPQAVYSALWGGDLVAFIEQSNLYRLFANTAYFSRRPRRSADPDGDQEPAAGPQHRLSLQRRTSRTTRRTRPSTTPM